MKELGIKDGKWIPRINEFGIDVIEEKSGFGIICFGSTRQLKDAEYPISMAKSHAILCADAGNTAQKCGLLPSELLQQRDELRELLKRFTECMRRYWADTYQEEAPDLSLVIEAEAAIKNTER